MRDNEQQPYIEFTEKDWRLAVQRWLLTAAINHVQGMEPATHHQPEMRAVWTSARQQVVASLRAEIAKWDDVHGILPRGDA